MICPRCGTAIAKYQNCPSCGYSLMNGLIDDYEKETCVINKGKLSDDTIRKLKEMNRLR